jgi:hypothetical protein
MNGNRLDGLFLPLIAITAEGLIYLLQNKFLIAAAVILGFLYLLPIYQYYFGSWQNSVGYRFFDGLEAAFRTADAKEDTQGDIPIYISSDVYLSYMYPLFFDKIPVPEFLKDSTVVSKVQVERIRNFYFDEDYLPEPAQKLIYVTRGGAPASCLSIISTDNITTDSGNSWQVGTCELKLLNTALTSNINTAQPVIFNSAYQFP